MRAPAWILLVLVAVLAGCRDDPTRPRPEQPGMRAAPLRLEPGVAESATRHLRWAYAAADSVRFRTGEEILVPESAQGALVFITNGAGDPLFAAVAGATEDVTLGPRSTVLALVQMALRVPYRDLSRATAEPAIAAHPSFAQAVARLGAAASQGTSYLSAPQAMASVAEIARDVGLALRPPPPAPPAPPAPAAAEKLYPIGILPVGVLEGEGTEYTVRNIAPLYWSVRSEDAVTGQVIGTKTTPPNSASLFQVPPIPLNPTETPLRGINGAARVSAEEDFSQNLLRAGSEFLRWALEMAGWQVTPGEASNLNAIGQGLRPEHIATLEQAESAGEAIGALLDLLADVVEDLADYLPRVGYSYLRLELRSLGGINLPLELIDQAWFLVSWNVYHGARAEVTICQDEETLVDCGVLDASLNGVTVLGSKTVRGGYGHLRCDFDVGGSAKGGDSGTWRNVIAIFPFPGSLDDPRAARFFDRSYFRSGERLAGNGYVYQDYQDGDGKPAWPSFNATLIFSYALASDASKTRSVSMLVTCLGGAGGSPAAPSPPADPHPAARVRTGGGAAAR
ncbi:MAG TPA: hypothetical protein VHG91_11400 [Longimicrobium sp.]|nr:hypothetical protein [Longimicrobium sp.]